MTDDYALLRRVWEGDEDAFGRLYSRHSKPVHRYALRMTGSKERADEMVQDVFLALIRGARGYEPSAGPLSSYLYGVARNLLAHSSWQAETEDLQGEIPAVEEDPLARLVSEQRVDALRAALTALPLHYREVLVLCELEELSYAEVAGILGVAVGTVRSRLSRARALLLERLCRAGVRS